MERLSPEDLAVLCPDAAAADRIRWCAQLVEYGDLLQRWARRMNLVARGDLPHLADRHLAPALRLRPLLCTVPHAHILDVGSGAGLPAIPLRITLPDVRLTLVESRRRRGSFLREAVRALGLERVEVRHQRLEEGGVVGCDIAMARAVAVTAGLVRDLRPWMMPGAFLLSTLPPGAGLTAPEALPVGAPHLLLGREGAAGGVGVLAAPTSYGLWRL